MTYQFFEKLGLFSLIKVLLLVSIVAIAPSAFAQTTQDINNIKVDELTDDQIRGYIAQFEASGLSEAQVEQAALQRGMSSSEVQKLRQRIEKIKSEDSGKLGNPNTKKGSNVQKRGSRTYSGQSQSDSISSKKDSISATQTALAKLRPKIFGADLFQNSQLTFEPNLRLATPANYQIGPDDVLLIDIYGYSEANYELKVTPEGNITIPYVGVVQVGGMSMEQATARIRARLSTIYSGLRSGNTSLKVALGNIRSIKVILTGEIVKPGTYTLPSLATAFNALYSSGGPTENGSFRQIEIIRAGRRAATLDLYDFLLNGQFKNNIRLQDQDVIRIPTYKKRVQFVGEVKRPGIYEMIENETLADLLRFTGGFNENAYQARVKVLKNTLTERKIEDITQSQFSAYKPSTGDKFFADKILDRFENRVTIEGAVFRPGQYELEPGLTIKQLIQKAEGLREDAFQNRAYITRIGTDMQPELVSVELSKILSGAIPDVPLKREDVINISSIFDLREEYRVQIDGEVQRPGTFDYAQGMTLEDLIIQAGGFKEGATAQRIEVSRRTRNSNVLSRSAATAEVFQVNANQDLKTATEGFVLQPFDIVVVRGAVGYEEQRQIKVEGEVLYPGTYTISKKDERISDVLKRVGGFTALAYPEGASLKRPGPPKRGQDSINYEQEAMRLKQFQRLQKNISDTLRTAEESVLRNNYVGINLPRIINKPGGKEDIFLEEGDILNIPKQLQTVKVSGEVLSPVTVIYTGSKGFKDYVSNAGGFSQRSRKRSSYIVYANGSVKSTKKFFIFNNYPVVKPGAEIFVPKKVDKNVNVQQVVALTTGIASLGAIIFGMLNLAK
ncbi:MAG TPA: SLBB domain-containing protein [Pedobacter sp.]|jgi:protein involved in polysaccharide export with SLBB domain